MKTLPWDRGACVTELRERIWHHLSPAARPEQQVLEALALLQLPSEDVAKLGRVHFLLSKEVGALVESLPGLARRMATTTSAEEEWSAERIRGPIQWSKTFAARAATGSPNMYVTAPAHRAYQTPENELLAFVLDAVVTTSRRSGWYGRAAEEAGRLVQERVSSVEKWLQSRSLLEVERRPPTPRSIRRVRSGRHRRRYSSVLDAHRVFTQLVARRDYAAVRDAVEQHALVTREDATLFELLCTFKFVDALKGCGWSVIPFRLFGGHLRLSATRGSNEKLEVWYQGIPAGLGNPSIYRDVLKAHGIGGAARLVPDLVVHRQGGAGDRWLLVEMKLGIKRSVTDSARAALSDLLAYRRAFQHALKDNPLPYGLGIAWGEDLAPSDSEVMLVSQDRLKEALTAVLG